MKKVVFLIFLLAFLISGCDYAPDVAGSGLGDTVDERQDFIDEDELPSQENDNKLEDDYNQVLDSDGGQDSSSQHENDYDLDAPPLSEDRLPTPWVEFTDAPVQNMPGNRSAEAYLAVLLQFGVDQNPCRYTKPCGGPDYTRCNIYASDVMNAMGAHLPTKGELGVGHGNAKTTDPMPANAEHTHNWLEQEKDGWRKLDPNNPDDWALLQEHLAAGKPALASHPDHIAVIRPDQPNGLAVGDTGGLRIAQSGAYNSSDTTAGKAFGNRTVGIYIHE